MKAKTELLLYQMTWMADLLLRPTWRNLTGSFEEWAYRNGLLRQIQKLEAEGWIESREAEDGTGRLHRLTRRGLLRALGGSDPEERWNRTWDGRWRMVAFDVPEAQRATRNLLRRQLRAARFGCLQGSLWISPDPVDEAVADLKRVAGSSGVLTFLDARPCGGADDQDLVSTAWDFGEIGRCHATHRDHLRRFPAAAGPGAAARLLAWGREESVLWSACLAVDPLLPRALWPPGYQGAAAWKERGKVLRRAGRMARRSLTDS